MITLTNNYHNTEVTLRDKAGRLTAAQVRNAKRRLCSAYCACSDFAGTRGTQYWGKGDARRWISLIPLHDGGAIIEAISSDSLSRSLLSVNPAPRRRRNAKVSG